MVGGVEAVRHYWLDGLVVTGGGLRVVGLEEWVVRVVRVVRV